MYNMLTMQSSGPPCSAAQNIRAAIAGSLCDKCNPPVLEWCGARAAHPSCSAAPNTRTEMGASDNWSTAVLHWYFSIVQNACDLGGFGTTPNDASGIAAYYSAQFVKRISQLSQPSTWARRRGFSSPNTNQTYMTYQLWEQYLLKVRTGK